MAFKMSKDRGQVWTPPYEADEEIRFKIKALTPLLNEQISGRHMSASLIQEDGRNKLSTNIKSFGFSREQAKAIVADWEGIVDPDGNPLRCTTDNIELLFDIWDDGGLMAAFVVKHANGFEKLREEQLGKSAPQSATS